MNQVPGLMPYAKMLTKSNCFGKLGHNDQTLIVSGLVACLIGFTGLHIISCTKQMCYQLLQTVLSSQTLLQNLTEEKIKPVACVSSHRDC